MATIGERMAALETSVTQLQKTIDDDIKTTLADIWKKVSEFPCGANAVKIEGLKTRMNWLYFAFAVVVIGGIVLGLWLRS